MVQKGEKLGIATKKVLKDGSNDIIPVENDPVTLDKFKMTHQEYQLILDTCKYKGITNLVCNPKSISTR